MRSYIIYNKRSCVTGKALFDALVEDASTHNLPVAWRRSNVTGPKRVPESVIRWGSSLHEVDEGNIPVLNRQEAVRNTADKLHMIQSLSQHDGVRVPDIALNRLQASQIADDEGKVFIRDRNDHVRYDDASTFRADDKYALRPINKQREFRVHVFNGKTLGIYEKIPESSTVKIYKNDNCTFRRLDQSSDEAMQGLKGNDTRIGLRPMAKDAVEAVGLLFGGVDVLMGEDGQFYINEVNTSPGLNTENLTRWAREINSYITNNDVVTDGGSPVSSVSRAVYDEPSPAELRAQAEEELETRRRDLEQRLRQNIIDSARAEGFAVNELVLTLTNQQ